MATATAEPCLAIVLDGPSSRPVRIYSYEGGGRVVVMLKLTEDGGLALVNRRLVRDEALPVAIWWALEATATHRDGYHVVYADELAART